MVGCGGIGTLMLGRRKCETFQPPWKKILLAPQPITELPGDSGFQSYVEPHTENRDSNKQVGTRGHSGAAHNSAKMATATCPSAEEGITQAWSSRTMEYS